MKVSIITPLYNQADYIENTIVSVLKQTYENIEYIVLDDGSEDNSRKMVEPYMDRLKYTWHENIGESKTVNKGYRMCTGDVVGIVNSDDPLFAPDAVARIVNCFRENEDGLAVYPDWVSIDENGNILSWNELPQYTIENMLRVFNVMLGPGMFIRRNILESIGYRNESLKFTGDLDVSFRLALQGKVVHVKGFLATHRVHGQSASVRGKGGIMVDEVVRLVKTTLQNPLLPKELRAQRRRLLAFAYLVSTHYVRKKYDYRFIRGILTAFLLDRSLVIDLSYRRLVQWNYMRFNRTFYWMWRQLSDKSRTRMITRLERLLAGLKRENL